MNDDRYESGHFEDDRDYRPRRRRSYYDDERDDYDEQFGYSNPRERLNAPGVALMIVGTLGGLLSLGILGIGAYGIIDALQANKAGPRNTSDMVAGIFILVGGLLSLAFCIVIALGGSRMRQCRNWGLAMTAAILSIASIALLGLLSIVIVPFGIWALVVLNHSEVKREFQRGPRSRPRAPRDAWDE